MRLTLAAVIVAVAVAVAASTAGSSVRATMHVSIAHAAFVPDPEAPDLPLGQTEWFTKLWVSLAGPRPCNPVLVRATSETYFNRELVDEAFVFGRRVDPGESVVSNDDSDPLGGMPGERIVVTVRSECEDGSEAAPPVEQELRVPPHSCEGGPWEALELEGHALIQHEPPSFRRLEIGDRMRVGDLVRTKKRGRLEFGAPECGVRFKLLPKSNAFIGSFIRFHQGTATDIFGTILARLSRGAGGVSTGAAWIRPVSARGARFKVSSRSPRLAVVDVFRGKVVISRAIDKTIERLTAARAGDHAVIRCTPYACTVEKKRLA